MGTLLTPGLGAQTSLYTLVGDNVFDMFGTSVDGAGDVNGDGFADVIVGMPGSDSNGADSGTIQVISGSDGTVIHSFDGDVFNDQMGFSAQNAGDVDGDGVDDIIGGAFGFDGAGGFNRGMARVYSGATGAVLHTFLGDSDSDEFGYAVSGAGDVDGDGFADLIVGAPEDDNNGSSSGSARVFSGQTGAIIFTFDGQGTFFKLGSAVSAAGDVNSDGRGDLLVGAPQFAGGFFGRAFVYSGADGSILYSYSGTPGIGSLGAAVALLGDLDLDGVAEFIVGAPQSSPVPSLSGSAFVYSGATGTLLHRVNGDFGGQRLGFSVSDAGDVDLDGVPDFLAGMPTASSRGAARLFSGATAALLYTYQGDGGSDQFGLAVGGAGDVNGDGIPEIIIGAPRADSLQGPPLGTGTARIIEHNESAVSNLGINYCIAEPNTTGASGHTFATGSAVASANNVTLRAEFLPSFSFGFFLVSSGEGFSANPGFSMGHFCLGGSPGRFVGPGQIQTSGSGSTASLMIDVTDIPQPNGSTVTLPGQAWHFQYWFRDSGPAGPASNFTNALRIGFQ